MSLFAAAGATSWVSGMEFVDNIKKGDEADNGMVEGPDKIVSMKLAANAQ